MLDVGSSKFTTSGLVKFNPPPLFGNQAVVTCHLPCQSVLMVGGSGRLSAQRSVHRLRVCYRTNALWGWMRVEFNRGSCGEESGEIVMCCDRHATESTIINYWPKGGPTQNLAKAISGNG